MSLIETARDLVKGLVPTEPEVGEHDTASASDEMGRGDDGHLPSTQIEASIGVAQPLDDPIERARREWERQPGHH